MDFTEKHNGKVVSASIHFTLLHRPETTVENKSIGGAAQLHDFFFNARDKAELMSWTPDKNNTRHNNTSHERNK